MHTSDMFQRSQVKPYSTPFVESSSSFRVKIKPKKKIAIYSAVSPLYVFALFSINCQNNISLFCQKYIILQLLASPVCSLILWMFIRLVFDFTADMEVQKKHESSQKAIYCNSCRDGNDFSKIVSRNIELSHQIEGLFVFAQACLNHVFLLHPEPELFCKLSFC